MAVGARPGVMPYSLCVLSSVHGVGDTPDLTYLAFQPQIWYNEWILLASHGHDQALLKVCGKIASLKVF